MPAYNEENNLERAVTETSESFQALGIQGEIVVIDDGSSDGTGDLAEKLKTCFPYLRVIHNPVNKGIGYSFWEGAKVAKGDVVTLLPGDGENDPVEILRYLPIMKEVDMVIPFVYNGSSRVLYRQWLSKLYKAIINFSFGLLLNYMNGTVMYRREVLQSLTLNSTGFFYQTELLIKAIRLGYLYAEVPYKLGQRAAGKSKALSIDSLVRLILNYFSTIYWAFVETRTKVDFVSNSAARRRRGRSLTSP